MNDAVVVLTPERLQAFLTAFREKQGDKIGMAQFIAAQDLMLALIEQDRLPPPPERFKTLLAPIVCSSEAEQQRFYREFDHWLASQGVPLPPESPAAPADNAGAMVSALPAGVGLTEIKRRTRPWPFVLGAIGVLLLVFLMIGYFHRPSEPPVKTQDIKKPDPNTYISVIPSTQPKTQTVILGKVVTTTPIEKKREINTEKNFFYTLASLPIITFAAWQLWRWWRRRVWLQRRRLAGSPNIKNLRVRHSTDHIFNNARFRRDFQRLHRHHSIPGADMDIDATVDATVRTAGLPTVVHGERNMRPAYLVLIDQRDWRDHQARLMEEWVRRMRNEGLAVEACYFFGDPRSCYRDDARRQPITLTELGRRYGDYRVLIATDAERWFDPLSGMPLYWLTRFADWPLRAVMTPVPIEPKGYRERVLQALGFMVVPMSLQGFALFSLAIAREVDSAPEALPVIGPDERDAASFPASLQRFPEHWLEPEPPDDTSLERLLTELKKYLGDAGYQWLAACAVYPGIYWHLTVYLGNCLARAQNKPPPSGDDYWRLARLPWFRIGFMPGYLRERLLRDLRAAETPVRKALNDLFHSALRQPADGFELDIAEAPKQSWSQMLRAFIAAEPADSPQREVIFASFMLGERLKATDFTLPRLLERLFHLPPWGLWNGRALGWAVLAVFASGLGVLGVWRFQPEPMIALLQVPKTEVKPTGDKQLNDGVVFRDVVADVETPEMVVIPAGKFTMGCVDRRDEVEGGCSDDEKPPHEVAVSSFAMSTTEVTVKQYMSCVQAGKCPEPEWREKGSKYNIETGDDDSYKKFGNALTEDNQPIVGVSWNNAQAYIKWLSEMTGMTYYLPSEAEWEYGARAGTQWAYAWGNAIGKNNANCYKDSCGDSYEYTSPVSSFALNPFGLYDMHGNVWEWVEDCWKNDYQDAPKDGSARKDCGAAGSRVLRGGSWDSVPSGLRSAGRVDDWPVDRDGDIGCRAARTRNALPFNNGSPSLQQKLPEQAGKKILTPTMAKIPSGTFQMGCVEDNKDCQQEERPVHDVKIAPFQLSVYEVTVGQFRAFVDATGYQTSAEKEGSCWSYDAKGSIDNVKGNSWRKTGYSQTDSSPVTCVSWEDAQAYLSWLSEQTGKRWRLPTEAEWEYAARAGTKTTYSWGDNPPVCDRNTANGAQFNSCKEKAPLSVGSFTKNPFGLYDMHGNVWEWVEDCWKNDYQDASKDGSARKDCGATDLRVLRGGSWGDDPDRLRSATRLTNRPDFRFLIIGFRAARTD